MAIDLGISSLDLGSFDTPNGPLATVTPPTSPLGTFDSTVSSIGQSVANIFNQQAAITQAQYNAKIAAAAGKNAVSAASQGVPANTNTLLLFGGAAVVLLLLLRKPAS